MQANVKVLNQELSFQPLSQDQVTAGITAFEEKYSTSIRTSHRNRFLRGNYRSLEELEKRLAAYRVFGDLGYGEQCFKSTGSFEQSPVHLVK